MANFKENLTKQLRSQRYEVHAGFMKRKKKIPGQRKLLLLMSPTEKMLITSPFIRH